MGGKFAFFSLRVKPLVFISINMSQSQDKKGARFFVVYGVRFIDNTSKEAVEPPSDIVTCTVNIVEFNCTHVIRTEISPRTRER